jgi:alcohol dehydrogenase class IV
MTSVPKDITARCGMDALTQLIESFTSINAQPITDSLAILGIQKIADSFKKAYTDGNNIRSRTDMAFGALLSGVCLANAGLGAVHGFASSIGAMFPIPHGTICAILLASTIQSNIRNTNEKSLLQKYAKIASILTSKHYDTLEEACNALIQFLKDLTAFLNIPPLGVFNVNNGDIQKIVKKSKKASSMKYNPVDLSIDDLTNIIQNVL